MELFEGQYEEPSFVKIGGGAWERLSSGSVCTCLRSNSVDGSADDISHAFLTIQIEEVNWCFWALAFLAAPCL